MENLSAPSPHQFLISLLKVLNKETRVHKTKHRINGTKKNFQNDYHHHHHLLLDFAFQTKCIPTSERKKKEGEENETKQGNYPSDCY